MIVLKIIGIMFCIIIGIVLFFVAIAVATKIVCWIYEKLFL